MRNVRLRQFNSGKNTVLLVFLVLSCCFNLSGADESDTFRERAQKAYLVAKEAFTAKPESFDAAWHHARACFDWAEFASTDTDRESLANEGIAAASRAIGLQSKSAAGYFYLAMNNGQLARTKTLGALRLVKDMERDFKKAAELDPAFEYAGADRSLGMLYFEAPGWPTSIGSKSKARTHLKGAIELVPNHPDNHLSWMEALLAWEEEQELRAAMRRYQLIFSKAKAEYKGEQWEASWSDWEKRWKKIQEQAASL